MIPSLPVVQSIEAEPEALEEIDPILWLHHVILIRLQGKKGIYQDQGEIPKSEN